MAIQLRRDTAANWTSANPVLVSGQPGYETDTNKMKVGDGSTAWSSLAYFPPSSGSGTVTSVSGAGTVSGLTLTGTVTTSGSLTLGGTLSVTPSNFASQTANTVLAAPNGSAGTPTFRAIVAADIPTLNQNTTGSAATITTGRDITMTGDVTWTVNFNGGSNVSAAGTIANSAVTLAKMANVATGTIFYRKTAGAGAPEVQTLATLKTDLGLTGTNTGDQTITLTGDVTGSGTGSFSAAIGANTVTNGKLSTVATGTIKGRVTAGTGNVEDLTGTQVTTLLDTATTSLKGLMSSSDKTKLDGIASGATANDTDANLKARANHTGTQTASTISDFDSSTRAQVEAELIAGTNVTITPSGSGATRQLTIASTGGGGGGGLQIGTAMTLAAGNYLT